MAQVLLKNVYKYYENSDKPAVSDFNLEIKDKEFVVFVGPSGCGKSTTLRMIAGLETISEGEVIIGDKVVNDVEPKNRDIAMVFQNYALYPHMSVYNNIAFGLRLMKIDDYKYDDKGEEVHFKRHYTKAEIDAKVHEAAKILEIEEYLDRKPKALSGGQRQRVAIGRAIVRNPKVFLMDEPLSNLDAKLRHQMRSEIILLKKRLHSTFIYVTHDQVEAMTLGDRIVIMKDGVIQQIGTPSEVFNNPANLFVAGFIGTPHMNLIKAHLNADYTITLNGHTITLPDYKVSRLIQNKAKPQNVILGIRPEHIKIVKNGELTSKVEIYEMMGSEYHVHTSIRKSPVVIRKAILGLNKKEEETILNGGEISYTFDKDAIQIFSCKDEKSLLF